MFDWYVVADYQSSSTLLKKHAGDLPRKLEEQSVLVRKVSPNVLITDILDHTQSNYSIRRLTPNPKSVRNE